MKGDGQCMARKLPRILNIDADRVAESMRRAERGEIDPAIAAVIESWGAMLEAQEGVTDEERLAHTVEALRMGGTFRVDFDLSVPGTRRAFEALTEEDRRAMTEEG